MQKNKTRTCLLPGTLRPRGAGSPAEAMKFRQGTHPQGSQPQKASSEPIRLDLRCAPLDRRLMARVRGHSCNPHSSHSSAPGAKKHRPRAKTHQPPLGRLARISLFWLLHEGRNQSAPSAGPDSPNSFPKRLQKDRSGQWRNSCLKETRSKMRKQKRKQTGSARKPVAVADAKTGTSRCSC